MLPPTSKKKPSTQTERPSMSPNLTRIQPREAHHAVERSRLFCLQQLSSQREFAIWCHSAANWHIEICALSGMVISSPMGDTLPLRTQRSTTRPNAGAPPGPGAGKGERQCRREPPLRAQTNGTPQTPCSPCSALTDSAKEAGICKPPSLPSFTLGVSGGSDHLELRCL